MTDDLLRRDFDDRDQLRDYLRELFPDFAAVGDQLSPFVGGRDAAEQTLAAIQPAAYGKTRNHLDGAVTKLSPYIRHRVLPLNYVRDVAEDKVAKAYQASTLVRELAWHDYFQRVYDHVGHDGVWQNLEAWKTGLSDDDYDQQLPDEIEAGETGIDWVDHFAGELRETGYLHNHARMWLAAYVVHARRIAWQAGAAWFLRHLVDGDPAANNLSWQWVASTFASKPYIMNRGNVLKNSGDLFARHQKNDPLDADYDTLRVRLFPDGVDAAEDDSGLDLNMKKVPPRDWSPPSGRGKTLCWVHREMLDPKHPALERADASIFVFADELLQPAGEPTSLKPVGFIYECLLDMPGVLLRRADDLVQAVLAAAEEIDAERIVTGPSPSPVVKRTVKKLAKQLPAGYVAGEAFVELDEPVDLKRFSRYWRVAEKRLKQG